MAAGPNLLKDSGLPLAFPVAGGAAGLRPPVARLGNAVRMVGRSLSVMQKDALVVSSRTGMIWRLASDEGAYLDGHDFAPPPLAFLSVGLTASWLIELRALAATAGIGATPRMVVDVYYAMSGSTTQGTMTGRADEIRIAIEDGDSTRHAALQELAAAAVGASPAHGLLGDVLVNRFALTHNGIDLGGLGVPALHAAPRIDPAPHFRAIAPEPGDWSGLLVNTGRISPRVAESAELTGDWLTDGKARRVRLRSFGSFDGEGRCVVEQHLSNPQGTIFRFLCDDRGRAPDPETYMAAGIGFCFMTQFGRYAKAMKRNLKDTRIVQDLQLSLPGASGGTGRAGHAAPLDTQVHLTSDEDDAFARTALAMAEQSCYLHTLCKTAIKPRLRVARAADGG